MADRQVSSLSSGSVRSGTYSGYLDAGSIGRSFGGANLSAAQPSSVEAGVRGASAFAKVNAKGQFSSSGAFSINGDVPVSMSMASWKHASRAGFIPEQGWAANVKNRVRSSGVGAANIGIVIDLTDFNRLARSFGAAAAQIKTSPIISRAINHGVRKLSTQLKYKVKDWTGIKRVSEVTDQFKTRWSTPGFLQGALVIKDHHRALTAENFDAKWSRKNPGATHRAWNRNQIAPHTFMVAGRKPIFKRMGHGRYPIAPLWGPNFAREVDRHKTEVQHMVDGAGRHVQAEASRLLRVAVTGTGRR